MHVKCRRRGERSHHVKKKIYSSCGFGESKKRRGHV